MIGQVRCQDNAEPAGLTTMTYHGTDDIPSDVGQVYRDLAITREQDRKRLQGLEEVEECFKWQIEPTGPISTHNSTRFGVGGPSA